MTMEILRSGNRVMQAIKAGDRQGLETILHGLTIKQAQRILHLSHRFKPHELLTPLLATVKFRRIQMMKYLLRTYQVDIEQKGVVLITYSDKFNLYEKYIDSNITALWYAAAEDLLEYVQVLVETFHADVNVASACNNTALHLACVRSNRDIIACLLKNGANPNVRSQNDDLTPLLCVLPLGLALRMSSITYHRKEEKTIEKLGLLLEHGADINVCSKTAKTTILHSAAEMGDIDLYQYLQQKGAKFTTDHFGQTPLHCACLMGHEKLYEHICSLPETTKQDQLTGLELIFVHMVQEDPMHSSMKLKEVQDMRQEFAELLGPQSESTESVWLNGCKSRRASGNGRKLHYTDATWQEGLLVIAKHFGTDSIHFAMRLFLSASRYDVCQEWDTSGILISSMEILCMKYKIPTCYVPVYTTMQLMRHLEGSGLCHQHNLKRMLQIIRMCHAVLQNAYLNPTPMLTCRTNNLIEVGTFYKAMLEAISLLISHNANIQGQEFKSQIGALVQLSDKLVEAKLAEHSFLQWLLDQPRTAVGVYSPAEHFDVVFYVLQSHPDVNVHNFEGDTPLHMLVKHNQPYTDSQFSLFLRKFESSNLHFDLVDAQGRTASDLCAVHSPDRLYLLTRAANSYISLKCLAARTVQREVPQYSLYLPSQLQTFVNLH